MINITKLPNSGIIRDLFNNYYNLNKTPDNNLSSMWKEFYPQIQAQFDNRDNLILLKSRGFSDINYSNPISKIFNHLCNLSYFLRLPYKNDLIFIMKKIRPKLKKIGSFITYGCFRQICSLITIKQYLKYGSNEIFDIVIIGDGSGYMSLLIKSLYPKARITLIDIGKVLLFQAINLQSIYQKYNHIVIDGDNVKVDKFDFLYVPSEKISEIKNIKYKLAINIASMQEMNYESIDSYFKFLRKNSTPDNLFYCCNRVLKKLPGGEILEFKKYPWHEKDRHILDEEPRFYEYKFISEFPFVSYLDGRMQHRLTNLFIEM